MATPPQDAKSINIILNIICAGLITIGLWQSFTNRLEDGLINIIIGVALITIPMSNGQFDYAKSPTWQKGLMIALSAFVVISTGVVLYLAFTR